MSSKAFRGSSRKRTASGSGLSESGERNRRGKPNAIDAQVGLNIRRRRLLLGLSLQSLAAAVRIGYQQLQRYEVGRDRVASSRLFDIARALHVPIDYFFDGAGNAYNEQRQASHDGGRDPMLKRETLELVRAYDNISDPRIRRSLLNMMKAISQAALRPSIPTAARGGEFSGDRLRKRGALRR